MGGSKVPEPFDVRMEEAEEAGSLPVEQDQKTRQPKSPSRTSQPSLNCMLHVCVHVHVYMRKLTSAIIVLSKEHRTIILQYM